MTELSWRHQASIQALLARGPLKDKDFHSMFNDLTGKDPGTSQQYFQDYLLKINNALSYVHLELRCCINQYDGQLYYGVVNTVSDEQSKLGTKYSVPQIAFYKAIIEAIAQDSTAQGVVPIMNALNFKLDSQVTVVSNSQSQGGQHQVPSALKLFSISQKEKTLSELARDEWLNLTESGNITLGVKSFLDLRSWFRNNDVPSCHVCNEAAVKAELCENESCTVRIHHYCLNQLFSQKKVRKTCPNCGTQWKHTVPKAEPIPVEDENEPRATQPATGSTGRKRRTITTVEEEVVESSHMDEPIEARESQYGARFVRKRRKTDRTDDAGTSSSQSSVASNLRRVTRSSARIM